jgi:hypothetical protein
MAKSTIEGTKKRTNGEAKARPARERRRTLKKADVVASAPDLAGIQAPSGEQIAKLAYKLYVQRGGVNGYHLEDWFEAERQLRGR